MNSYTNFLRAQIRGIVKAFNGDDNITHTKKEIFVQWKFPSEGWVSLNTDGASWHGNNRAACGGVILDHIGSWLSGFVANIGPATAIEVELQGIYHGPHLAWSQGFKKVTVASDS